MKVAWVCAPDKSLPREQVRSKWLCRFQQQKALFCPNVLMGSVLQEISFSCFTGVPLKAPVHTLVQTDSGFPLNFGTWEQFCPQRVLAQEAMSLQALPWWDRPLGAWTEPLGLVYTLMAVEVC